MHFALPDRALWPRQPPPSVLSEDFRVAPVRQWFLRLSAPVFALPLRLRGEGLDDPPGCLVTTVDGILRRLNESGFWQIYLRTFCFLGSFVIPRKHIFWYNVYILLYFNIQVFIIYTNIYTYFRCIPIHDIVPIPYFCGSALSSPSGGHCLWSFHLDGHAFAAPCVTKDMAYIATHGQTLFAISLSLGKFFKKLMPVSLVKQPQMSSIPPPLHTKMRVCSIRPHWGRLGLLLAKPWNVGEILLIPK